MKIIDSLIKKAFPSTVKEFDKPCSDHTKGEMLKFIFKIVLAACVWFTLNGYLYGLNKCSV